MNNVELTPNIDRLHNLLEKIGGSIRSISPGEKFYEKTPDERAKVLADSIERMMEEGVFREVNRNES